MCLVYFVVNNPNIQWIKGQMKFDFKKIRGLAGIGVLVMAFAASAFWVGYNDAKLRDTSTVRIRFCHWNLEAAPGFEAMIKDFQSDYFKKTGKKVVIEQIPVPYTGYAQYTNTGLIGKTAPDIIQIGCSGTLANVNNIARYFMPLGEQLSKPNPWNTGTPLEGVPWKDTFLDGMQSFIEPGLQEYYKIPLSTQNTRIYYNKNLLRDITDSDKFPEEYRDFIVLCEKVTAYSKSIGREISPIAACYFQKMMFKEWYLFSFMQDMIPASDFNFDGSVDKVESYNTRGDKWSFRNPEIEDSLKCSYDVVKYFMPGWMAAARDDMAFSFVQQKSLMTLTWGYDAKMIRDQVAGSFEIGISEVPMPFKDPVYSKYVKQLSEVTSASANPQAINASTKYPELCISFLQYATTSRANEKFNDNNFWIPIVKNTKIGVDWLKPFAPRLDGYAGRFEYNIGTQFNVVGDGYEGQFYSGRIPLEKYISSLSELYAVSSERGFQDEMDRRYRVLRGFDRFNTVFLLLSYAGPEKGRKTFIPRLAPLNWSVEKQLFEYSSHLALAERNKKREGSADEAR